MYCVASNRRLAAPLWSVRFVLSSKASRIINVGQQNASSAVREANISAMIDCVGKARSKDERSLPLGLTITVHDQM